MFQTACELLFRHCAILPVEASVRYQSGEVIYSIGAGILVNRDGWILTAGHMLQNFVDAHEAIKEANLHRKRAEEIRNASNLPHKEKQKQLKSLGKINPNLPTNKSLRAAQQGHNKGVSDVRIFAEADLGVFRIEDFAVPDDYATPYFRKEPLRVGEAVCRIGYPFYSVEVKWDEQNKRFLSRDEPISPFANDGIVSRFIAAPEISKDLPIQFIETSTPGLQGQSGGPLVDKEGRICGIQSHTACYPLGFSPQEKGQVEHQFLNVGRSTQVSEVCKFLSDHNVPYSAQ